MAGINEVAARAAVSTATVSRALSGRGYVAEATRARVLAAARELGYVVSSSASGLASGRTRNVGVVVPSLSHWFFATVVEGIQTLLQERGYDLTLYNFAGGPGARARVFDELLLRQRVDAVLAVGLELTADEVSLLHSLNKPLVGLGGPIEHVPSLQIDDRAAMRLAVEHLIGLDHTRIAFIGGTPDLDRDFHLPTRRQLGYRDALDHAGIALAPELEFGADFTLAGGHRAARQLLGTPGARPTAIAVASDEMAIGALIAARDLGLRVPEDLSVVGLDDHPHAEFFGLTTVAQHPACQGRRAAELLTDLIARGETGGEPAPAEANITLPIELVVRSSSSRPAAL